MRTVAISTKHITNPSNNSEFSYPFPSTANFTQQNSIGLSSLSIFYSWNNISAKKNNNKFQYVWNGVTKTLTIPDGQYEISALNKFLQFEFISNNHYLVNSNGDYVYFAEFLLNNTEYGVNIITYAVPSAASTTYPAASNTHFTFSGTSYNPVIQLGSLGDFHKIIGYASTFASSAVAQTSRTYSSSTAPIINPDSNIVVSINGIINNPYSSPNSIVYSFGISAGIGQQILEKPSQVTMNPIQPGSYSNLDVRILNADTLLPVEIKDPEVSIVFVIN